jgi:hypothetical protein
VFIRFKKDDLGYTIASRAFRTEAGKCGNNTQKQLARVQHEYNTICLRHAGEGKLLIGVDKAFKEFYTQMFGVAPCVTDPYDASAPPAPSPPGPYTSLSANPTYVPTPPSPQRWDS